MTEAFIVDAVRTAVGKRGGGFAAEHPADMAAHVINAVVSRHDVDPAAVDDVILGCPNGWMPPASFPAACAGGPFSP